MTDWDIARRAAAVGLAFLALAGPVGLAAQSTDGAPGLDRVLAFPAAVAEERLDPDRGAMGAWQRILKLGTTASLLHVTAHPDDENSGMLTFASRGWGARTALLSLNRGEAGANAIGPELFDGLGLIRTRELVLAGRYYGLDDLYFTTAVDYGYSKTVEEAYRSWDPEAVLEDMVRVVRLNRPLVVVARFHGSRRDGHGHHHASGLLTPEAVEAAADPARFPGQIGQEGLRPWRVLRTYRGGIRVDEPFHVQVDARGESPWVGTSFQAWASRGLGLQRSQTAGRVRVGGGLYRYELRDGGGSTDGSGSADARGRGDEALPASQAEESFFAGLDTSLNGLPALLGEPVSPETSALLARLQGLVDEVAAGFDFRAPGQSVPDLVRGLGLLRSAIASSMGAPETRFQLRLKERQFEDAIAAASGLLVEAGLPGGAAGAVVVPGQSLAVGIAVEVTAAAGVGVSEARVVDRAGVVVGRTSDFAATGSGFAAETEMRMPEVDADADAEARAAAPYFARDGIAQNHYQVADSADLHLPWRRPALSVAVDLVVEGTTIVYTAPVTAPVPRLPYGSVTRPVEVLPALSVVVDPPVRVVPVEVPAAPPGNARPGSPTATSDGPTAPANGQPGRPTTTSDRPAASASPQAVAIPIQVRVTANTAPLPITTRLEVPAGWAAAPATVAHDFARAGEVAEVAFLVTPPDGWEGAATIEAVSRAGGRGYRAGYQTIDHRDLRLARLWRPATTTVRSVPVARLEGARVGYVMGVGDEVPAGIESLGARVEMLDAAAGADPASLSGLDAIVVGTRAYAVREDLLEHNQRLIEYARAGGHLVILYQTQEFVPGEMAPYPASLPRGAEEVSEEDAPVRLLQPTHPFMTTPNRITEADFDGWVEQRGSKFFTEWDAAYTPLVETHDQGQDPQEGIWLTAEIGEGHYTYLALALHRQLPYGVPGAFRMLSNVLSAGGGR
ncbi:MAG: PIG-L family deacetylase [Gammaproteobacteria bacterium]|nr:PIG-L family deacetylase [Gammaproteobacteria bacterium]